MLAQLRSLLGRGPVRRFVVSGPSMEPTLVDGHRLIGVRSRRAKAGQLRAVEHPLRPGFWLVKRVSAVSGDSMVIESDNDAIEPTDLDDSNRFGPVDVAGSWRIVARVPRRWM